MTISKDSWAFRNRWWLLLLAYAMSVTVIFDGMAWIYYNPGRTTVVYEGPAWVNLTDDYSFSTLKLELTTTTIMVEITTSTTTSTTTTLAPTTSTTSSTTTTTTTTTLAEYHHYGRPTPGMMRCFKKDDCTLISCCPCQLGGTLYPINKDYVAKYQKDTCGRYNETYCPFSTSKECQYAVGCIQKFNNKGILIGNYCSIVNRQ